MLKPIHSTPSLFLIIVLILNVLCTSLCTQNYTFLEENLESNILVTSKYALFGQNMQPQPTLKKLIFETMKLETIIFDKVEDWADFYHISLVDLNNGDIAFGQFFQLFILNNETLTLKQRLGKVFSPIEQIADIKSYTDRKTNQSVHFVGRQTYGSLYSQLKKESNGTYVPEFRYATPSSQGFQMYLTGVNTATSLNGCDISYWTNLYSVADRQTDMKYFMKNQQQVAVSYDERYFVLRNQTGFYEFYSLEEDYEIKLSSAIFVNYNEHRKGVFTNDDKLIFVSLSNPRDKHNIAKIDIIKEEFTIVTDTDGSSDNQMDFTLFSSSYNRFITLAVKNKNYYLQLRTIDSLHLLHEIMLQFDFPVLEYKLIGGPQWGLSFVLAARIKPYAYDLEKDSKIFLFSAEGDKISKQNFSPAQVSFASLKASYKYIISYKPRFTAVKLFHFSNLSLAHQFQTSGTYDVDLTIEKSIIKMDNSIYNVEQSLQSRGWFFYDPNPEIGQMLSIIFQNRGLLYYAPTYAFSSFTVTKTVYNISSLPVTSSISMNSENPYSCQSTLYFIPPQYGTNKCNYVFYIETVQWKDAKLIRYDECAKAKLIFNVESFSDQLNTKLSLSSDKKYIIIIVSHWATEQVLFEIRPIAFLDKIIYHKIISIERIPSKYILDGVEVDLVNDKMLILKTLKLISVFSINEDNDEPQKQSNLLREAF